MTQNQTNSLTMTATPVLNVYDFDGVLASPFEEALFTMPETPRDADLIAYVEREFGVDLSLESRRSARYIALQAVLTMLGDKIRRGPMFERVQGPYYILTARCDRFALIRMHQFVEQELTIKPIKIMHVDHLPKGVMLDMLLDKHPNTTIRFWDDNPGHILSADSLGSRRLQAFHVDNDMEPHYILAQSYYERNILDQIL